MCSETVYLYRDAEPLRYGRYTGTAGIPAGPFYDPVKHRLSGTGQPGADPDLGSIHWKLSSKLDNLIVREFAYPANYSVLIL